MQDFVPWHLSSTHPPLPVKHYTPWSCRSLESRLSRWLGCVQLTTTTWSCHVLGLYVMIRAVSVSWHHRFGTRCRLISTTLIMSLVNSSNRASRLWASLYVPLRYTCIRLQAKMKLPVKTSFFYIVWALFLLFVLHAVIKVIYNAVVIQQLRPITLRSIFIVMGYMWITSTFSQDY